MFEDENLNDMDVVLDVVPSHLMRRLPPASPFHCFPSPTEPPSPGVSSPPASPFQKEDFGECVSQPSVEVFGVVCSASINGIMQCGLLRQKLYNGKEETF